MTTETETNRGRFFVPSLLPWLIAGGMLLVYLLTLNHWPSTNNIFHVSELSGWYSTPHYFAPLTFLLTYPLRWLPVAFVGTGLNLFTAGCAALTLALLARSVALLPHDRTYEQRLRETSEFSLLTIPTAWLPPLFAALVCGLQLTFWQNAVNTASENRNLTFFGTDAAGEMLDLLLFAYCIRCLLEYRISLKDSWMARFAFVYGLSMADNWLMVGLFPAFLAAIIWIRGLSFFNARFLGIVALFGLAGLSLIFLFPILTSHAHIPGSGFWQVLRFIIREDKVVLSALPREVILLLSLTSLLPVFVIGIRWASYFGDTSKIGIFLATFTFHVVHALFLLVCIWVAFDPPFSPRQKVSDFSYLPLPFLPLYYLGALSIGYFVGYFLLVFGTRPPQERHRPHQLVQFINYVIVACIWFLAMTVPVFQVWLNLPQIRADEAANAAFARLGSTTIGSLPAQGAVVLSDDRLRLSLLEVISGGGAENKKHLFLNTGLLAHDPFYIRALEKEYPGFNLTGSLTNWTPTPPFRELIRFLEKLGEQHDLYYIHPSFGYYFERFYMEPRGGIYQLMPYDTNTWKAPPLTTQQIDQNQSFWKNMAESELPNLTNLIGQPKRPVSSPLLQHFMDSGHLTLEPNRTALLLGSDYARSLDYWGVALEKAALLPDAAIFFEQALQLNPDSVAARVNAQFNRDLQAGKKIVIEPPADVLDSFGKHRGWTDLLNSDGPFDNPSFCYMLGVAFAAGENYRPGTQPRQGNANYLQAIQQFERVHALAPDYPDAAYWLCNLYIRFRKSSEALTIAEQVLHRAPDDLTALYYSSVALMQLGSSDKALKPLNHLLALQTNNYTALLERAISQLQLTNYSAAKADYESLLKVAPKAYQIDYGLQEIYYHQKDTNNLIKYLQLYRTNYFQSFPTNYTPPETDELKLINQRLMELKNGAP